MTNPSGQTEHNALYSSPATLIALSHNTVASVTHSSDKRLVLEPVLGVAIRRMPAVTAHARTGIRVCGLPLRQETVKVIVSRPPGGYLLVALETVFVAYRYSLFRRLDGGMGIQR